MATNYKILGQGVNQLKIDAPTNGSTIISELKIKNTSYPTNVDVMCSNQFSTPLILDDFQPQLNSAVSDIAIDADGNIIAVGGFSTVDGVAYDGFARFSSSGVPDAGLSLDIAGGVITTVAIQPDGKILIGGTFTAIDGVAKSRIARLNADGTLDTTFNASTSGTVFDITLLPDGKILVAGSFLYVNDVYTGAIARLNADGTLDKSFFSDASSVIYSIALQSDGRIIVSGNFSAIGGVIREGIARLNADGTLDTTFYYNGGLDNGSYSTLAVQSDDKIIIGGYFLYINNVTKNAIARLNADGTLDTSFNVLLEAPPGVGGYDDVTDIKIQPDGKIIISGSFSKVNGVRRGRIVRLNSDGTPDNTIDIKIDTFGEYVSAVALGRNNEIIFGGFFSIPDTSIARLAILIEHTASENKDYIIKNKSLSYDEEIKISGGIALESGQSLVVDTRKYSPDTVIIQAYGIEETA